MSMLGGNPSASLLQHLLFVQGWAPWNGGVLWQMGKSPLFLESVICLGFFHICWLGVCYVIESCAPKIVRCVLFFNWCQILWARSHLLPFVFMVNLSHSQGMSWITDYRKLGIMRGGMAWWLPVSIVASTAILRRLCCILLLKNTVFFHCRTECMVPSRLLPLSAIQTVCVWALLSGRAVAGVNRLGLCPLGSVGCWCLCPRPAQQAPSPGPRSTALTCWSGERWREGDLSQ